MIGAVIAVSRLYAGAAPKCENFAVSKILKQCFYQGSSHLRFYPITQGVRNFSNVRIFSPNRLWSSKKDLFKWSHLNQHRLLNRSHRTATNPLTIKTNVKNNVLLFRYEKPWMFKLGTFFGVCACIGCLTMADGVYKVLCKNLFNPDIPLKQRLIEHILPLAAILVGVIGGPAILLCVCYIVKRTVKYIILHKGGNEITLVTYHPFKNEVKRTLPLNHIQCTAGREVPKQYVPLKIKDTSFYYVVDKSGQFVNPELFDATCGVTRDIPHFR